MMSIPSEVIEISSDVSIAFSPPVIKKDPSPVIRRGKQGHAQHVPSAAPPGKLQLGQAVKEKQHHQDLVAARSPGRRRRLQGLHSKIRHLVAVEYRTRALGREFSYTEVAESSARQAPRWQGKLDIYVDVRFPLVGR